MDLQDISSQDLPLFIKISQRVLLKEIKDAIRKLFIRKAAGLNRILNKAIKAALKTIAIFLINIVTTYFFKSKILDCCKETIIIILQKVNKKDYLLLGSY